MLRSRSLSAPDEIVQVLERLPSALTRYQPMLRSEAFVHRTCRVLPPFEPMRGCLRDCSVWARLEANADPRVAFARVLDARDEALRTLAVISLEVLIESGHPAGSAEHCHGVELAVRGDRARLSLPSTGDGELVERVARSFALPPVAGAVLEWQLTSSERAAEGVLDVARQVGKPLGEYGFRVSPARVSHSDHPGGTYDAIYRGIERAEFPAASYEIALDIELGVPQGFVALAAAIGEGSRRTLHVGKGYIGESLVHAVLVVAGAGSHLELSGRILPDASELSRRLGAEWQ